MGGSSADRSKVAFLFTAAQQESSAIKPYKNDVKVCSSRENPLATSPSLPVTSRDFSV